MYEKMAARQRLIDHNRVVYGIFKVYHALQHLPYETPSPTRPELTSEIQFPNMDADRKLCEMRGLGPSGRYNGRKAPRRGVMDYHLGVTL